MFTQTEVTKLNQVFTQTDDVNEEIQTLRREFYDMLVNHPANRLNSPS